MFRLERWSALALMTTMLGCGGSTEIDDALSGSDQRPKTIACGVLGGAEDGRVWGWAQIVDADPVAVRVEVDGNEVARTLASIVRDDLVKLKLHPTGEAGFSVRVDSLVDGMQVRAFIDELDQELTNSPLVSGPPPSTSSSSSGGGSGGAGSSGSGGASSSGGVVQEPKGWCNTSGWTVR
jgi:uncharacterized membrane protein YgcG